MKKSQLKSLIEEIVKQSLLFETIQDPTKEEMLNYLRSLYGQEEGFVDDAEVAMYWFANFYHGGQSSNLYSVLSNSRFNPGPIAKGPEPHSSEEMMYEDLVVKFFPTSEEGQSFKRKHNALNEAISPKNQALIEKWMKAEGARKTAYKMINSMVMQRTGMDIRDMADTATLASGIDTVEQALNEGNFESALKLAVEAAKEFFDEEAGEGLFENGLKGGTRTGLKVFKNSQGRPFKACNKQCAKAFISDRNAGLIYGPYREKNGTFLKDAEEASMKWNQCAYCNFKGKEPIDKGTVKEASPSPFSIPSERADRLILYGLVVKAGQKGYLPEKGVKGFETSDKIVLAKTLPNVVSRGSSGGAKEYLFFELTNKSLKAGISIHPYLHRKYFEFTKKRAMDANYVIDMLLRYSQIPKQTPRSSSIQENEELEEGNRLKALAAAGLIGYAGLHTPFAQQALAKAGRIPTVQQSKQTWQRAMTPRHLPNQNEPLPDEKNMNAWDLTNKYVNRNADIEKKTSPFVKKYLPPVKEVTKPDESFFPTLDKALEAIELYLDKNKAVVDDNEHPKDEKVDRHGIRKPFMFGGIVYETSREAHYKLLTLNGNFTRKYLHVIIYRMPQGSYELTRYIA